MKRIALLALASGMAIAAAAPANAAVYFAYSTDGGVTKTTLGSVTGDNSGNAAYSGTVAGYTFNLSALAFPALTQPDMLTNAIDVQTAGVRSGTGSLTVYITQTDLASYNGFVRSSFTANTLTGSAQSVSMSTLFSTTNALFGGTLIAAGGPFTNLGTSSSINALNAVGPFSTTVSYNMTFGTGVGSFNDTVNLQAAVPEPATWGMMIVGFGLMGGVLRRRSTKVAFA